MIFLCHYFKKITQKYIFLLCYVILLRERNKPTIAVQYVLVILSSYIFTDSHLLNYAIKVKESYNNRVQA